MRTAALACLLLLPSCGLDEITVRLDGTAEIPGSPLGGVLMLPELPVAGLAEMRFSDARELKNEDVHPDDIDSVRLVALTLSGESGEKLDFLSYVEFFASAPGLPEVRVARKHVPDGATRIEMDVLEEELRAYATAPSMTVRSSVTGEQPRETVRIRVEATFAVDVRVGGF